MRVEVDFPLVRSQAVCALCRGAKELGGLVCWPCYGAWQTRYGNAEADKLIVAFAEKLRAEMASADSEKKMTPNDFNCPRYGEMREQFAKREE